MIYKIGSQFTKRVLGLCVSLAFLASPGFSSKKEQVTVIDPNGNKVIEYAVTELNEILKNEYDVSISNVPNLKGWNIELKVDSSMDPFSFSVIQLTKDKNKTISLSGHDETCVLHSVYTMLEKTGYIFDITGIRRSEEISL